MKKTDKKTLLFTALDAAVWCVSLMLFGDFVVSEYVWAPAQIFVALIAAQAIPLAVSAFVFLRLRRCNVWRKMLGLNVLFAVLIGGVILLSYFPPFVHLSPLTPMKDDSPVMGLPIMLGWAAFACLFILTRAGAAISLAVMRRRENK